MLQKIVKCMYVTNLAVWKHQCLMCANIWCESVFSLLLPMKLLNLFVLFPWIAVFC